jgi:hypothetical protein
MTPIRVLVANEPSYYREVIAAGLSHLRPRLEVVTIDPAELDVAIIREAPQIVICSRLTGVVQSHASSWLLLYPDGANVGHMNVAGVAITIENVDFDDVLTLVDETERWVGSRIR